MEIVEILANVELATMLKKLHLPFPGYKSHTVKGCGVVATVVFYPSVQHLWSLSNTQMLSSDLSDSLEAAANDVVVQAITYMETIHKKVLKDFSYTDMEKKKKGNEALHRKIISEKLHLGCSAPHDEHIAALFDIQTVTSSIDQLTSESTRMLKAIGPCLYDTKCDPTAYGHSLGFYRSDIDPWNNSSSSSGGAYEHAYNSNGLP